MSNSIVDQEQHCVCRIYNTKPHFVLEIR